MASKGFEEDEWGEEFLQLIVRAEEQRGVHHHHTPPTPPSSSPLPIEASKISAVVERIDYCAPVANSCGKEVEIDRLKNELGRLSKQLNLLEKECSELRKERGKKEEQLKVLIHPKDAELDRANSSDYS